MEVRGGVGLFCHERALTLEPKGVATGARSFGKLDFVVGVSRSVLSVDSGFWKLICGFILQGF